MLKSVAIIVLAFALAGCSQRGLMELRNNSAGPDEFLVIPKKQLVLPESLAALPEPTPGGTNRTDQNPKADAIAALGGRPEALAAQKVPSSDAALVAQTRRYGAPGNIRQDLAVNDAEFRRRQARGTRIRLFPVDRYQQAYRREALDPFQEAEFFRRSGLQTSTSPPLRRQ
ncbi:MAG: DUF3035 domain-containing protein [Arenibacterium sp.]